MSEAETCETCERCGTRAPAVYGACRACLLVAFDRAGEQRRWPSMVERFEGFDLQRRRREPRWPAPWRARIRTAKNERASYRLTAYGETADEACAKLAALVAEEDARPTEPERRAALIDSAGAATLLERRRAARAEKAEARRVEQRRVIDERNGR